MRLALWIALLVPLAAMYLGLKTKKFAWNCVLTLSCRHHSVHGQGQPDDPARRRAAHQRGRRFFHGP